MLRGFLGAVVCSFLLMGGMHAQEVIVARETKPDTAKPPAQEMPKMKSKTREKKSSSKTPTLEEMRMAGARAAERLNNPTPSSPSKPAEPESETIAREAPAVLPTATPAKKESREQKRASHRAAPGTTKPDSVGAIRPTMIETGRQEQDGTPLPKWQTSGEQTPAP
jgi:hypothetical protein